MARSTHTDDETEAAPEDTPATTPAAPTLEERVAKLEEQMKRAVALIGE